ncbi:alpha/beta hydrolase [Burkholderia sp. ABCPW 111]|uniref:alpha/beta hydrolase n=1 Tax=Burkholderia sp. ABCPW 111 TaxID=1820025 RepID=UPI0005311A4C|nr:alpha/beta hydrolase-fold protein [Burkholderia sp. ABCPW 111]KGS03573.1 prolyl oligopeptidase family protein [Burkholderia sp. ABCPW 111]
MPGPAFAARRSLLAAGLGTALSSLSPLPCCAAPANAARGGTRGTVALPGLADAPAVETPRSRRIDVSIAGQRRRIFVALPPPPAPPAGHPVLYALDGNAAFHLFAQLARNHAARPGVDPADVPAIVALGYATDASYDMQARAADYTLAPLAGEASAPIPRSAHDAHASEGNADDRANDADALPSAGAIRTGADRFLDFVEHDLQPWLAGQFAVDARRQTLFGHSYGGLLTLYAMLTRTHLFRRYVAASPSIWWGDRALVPFRDRFVERTAALDTPVDLLVTVGSLEEGAPNPDPERARRQQARKQVSSAREFVHGVQPVRGLHAECRVIAGEDHGSVVLPSAALAVRIASAPETSTAPATAASDGSRG